MGSCLGCSARFTRRGPSCPRSMAPVRAGRNRCRTVLRRARPNACAGRVRAHRRSPGTAGATFGIADLGPLSRCRNDRKGEARDRTDLACRTVAAATLRSAASASMAAGDEAAESLDLEAVVAVFAAAVD